MGVSEQGAAGWYWRRLPRLAGAFAVAVGLLILVWWRAGLLALISVRADWPLMQPMTAVEAILAGIALMLAAPAEASAPARGVAALCVLVTSAVAVVVLAEYATGTNIAAIEKLFRFVAVRPGLPGATFPGRSAPITAVAFIVTGAALLALLGRAALAAQILALAVASIAVFALLGYMFGVPAVYRAAVLGPGAGMAIHTAVVLIVLGAGVLAARPSEGIVSIVTSPRAGGVTARRLLPGMLAFLPLAFLVLLGEYRGWYGEPMVLTVLAYLALVESTIFVLVTAHRLNLDDAARLESERRSRESERRYRELFEHASDGIFIADLDGRYTDVNGAGCRMLGCRREEILGKRITDFIPVEEAVRLEQEKARMLVGQVVVSDWRMRRADGSWLPIEVSAAILADGRWQGFARDISERQRTERWLRATIDQMPEGVILLDEHGRVTAMNRVVQGLSCGDSGEVDPFGNPMIFDAREPDGKPISFDRLPLVRAFTQGEVTRGREGVLRTADGRMVPVLVNAAPVRDDQQRIAGAAVVLQDITAIKELERLREEWTSVVAHDLRQPVGAIALTAQALVRQHEEELPDKERRGLERIQATSERLNRMIDDLLDVSLIDAKRVSLNRRAVDMVPLVDAVIDGLRDALAGRQVGVTAAQGLVAWIDPDRIHQVLTNLLSNAAKYGSLGSGVRIQLTGDADTVEVTVTNWGAGIPPDELATIFERFHRARGARTGAIPGLGLGLYIARGVIEAHGGRIWAESTPDQSTSFHFTVPRATGAPEPRVMPQAPSAP